MKRKHINNRFKYARLYAGYTQAEAAKASGFMTKQALSHYEKAHVLQVIKFFTRFLNYIMSH